ncbi:MAG TPA: HDOD domain-containing protein [bacterium]|nr:HDOD domain-containing protein [bacterium]
MDEKKAALVLKHIDRMPSLSPTVGKILQVANDPASSANDLNKVISLDPVLAGKVLKLVNSAYFGFNEKVTSTVRAIVMLGLNTIKNLALSTAAMETLTTQAQGGINMDEYWRHLLATGVFAKLIARKMNIHKNFIEDYFLAGLMHDIGKVVLNRLNPVGYSRIVNAAKEKGKPLYLYEAAIFGISHPEIGKILGEKWGLQPSLAEAISLHHSPSLVSEPNRKIVYSVLIANNYCRRLNVGFSGNVYIEQIPPNIWDELSIPEESLADLEGMLLEGVERASVFIQTTQK